MSDEDDNVVMVEHPPEEEEEDAKGEDVSRPGSPPELVEKPSKEEEPVKPQEEAKEETEAAKEDEEEELPDHPQPLQIVSVGTEEDAYAFTFEEEKLNHILSKVPPGWKVSVVSVVGAFRTGKSFLLSWFLRYLNRNKDASYEKEGEKWYNQFKTLGKDGFDWRGGADRNTTGIWMWSEPHCIENESGEQIAIVLVDTQGMFDHETTMALTASIFGLSTLLSSYQIYNVDKRIQEDNLQQLALFSEYARMAMSTHDNKKDKAAKPFQQIEFLVRDWQHFEEEEDFDLMEKEVDKYLEDVIANRDAKDLQETREQILGCFEKVSCYAMTHPGFAVTKKKYNGDVSVMDETFLEFLDRYCARVFDLKNVQPKKIHGRELTAVELGSYIKAYAGLFAAGAHFPEASTLLEATSQANNTNAVHMAMKEYKDRMDRIAGPRCTNFIRAEEFKELHQEVVDATTEIFESIATFGSQRDIDTSLAKVKEQIEASFELYTSLNESRNPLAGMEMYLIPMGIALVSYILRWVSDLSCSSWSQTCKATSDVLSHFYAVAFCFMFIIAATKFKQIQDGMQRLRSAIELMQAPPEKAKAD